MWTCFGTQSGIVSLLPVCGLVLFVAAQTYRTACCTFVLINDDHICFLATFDVSLLLYSVAKAVYLIMSKW